MRSDQKQALRMLLAERGEDESYTDVVDRLIKSRNRGGWVLDKKTGGHDWKSAGAIDKSTGYEPVQCKRCLVFSEVQRDLTHSEPRHEKVYLCERAPKGAKVARIIIELDGRRGYAQTAVVPLWDESFRDMPVCFGVPVDVEWCQIFASKIAIHNVVRIAIADMICGGKPK